jgi:hypothetical protein
MAVLLILSGCATQPPEQSSYFRTRQTQLILNSAPQGTVNIDNRYVGVTPMSYPLQYEQQVERDTTNVTLWQTEPGLALFLTIASLGLYLPFSAIPADTQTSLVPQDVYRHNDFQITVDAPGYAQWKQDLAPKGEQALELQAQLVKKSEN